MLMGARTYLPALGIFTSSDPIIGGNDTAYSYPTDPIGSVDLDGNRGIRKALRSVASHVVSGVAALGNGMSSFLGGASKMAKRGMRTQYARTGIRSVNELNESSLLRSMARVGRTGAGAASVVLGVVAVGLTYVSDRLDGHSDGYALGHAIFSTAVSIGTGILFGAALSCFGPVGTFVGGAVGSYVGGLAADWVFGKAASLFHFN
jgi:phage tail tape-measure protein